MYYTAPVPAIPPFIAKNHRDGSFHELLSIISYRLAHLRPHLQPCTEWPAISFPIFQFVSLSRYSVSYLFKFYCLSARFQSEKCCLSFSCENRMISFTFVAKNVLATLEVYFKYIYLYLSDSFLCEFASHRYKWVTLFRIRCNFLCGLSRGLNRLFAGTLRFYSNAEALS